MLATDCVRECPCSQNILSKLQMQQIWEPYGLERKGGLPNNYYRPLVNDFVQPAEKGDNLEVDA